MRQRKWQQRKKVEKTDYYTISQTERYLFQFLYKSDDNQTELLMTQLAREFPEHINLW